ncbi:MAG: tetratricopeptide repeat protein [Caldilineaceae bacterium]
MPLRRLFLFGSPRLEQDGQPLPLPGRKLSALLAYLAATAQPHSRDRLATLFWPEFDQSTARANLRRELSGLRTIFGPTYLQSEREQVSLLLGPDLWLDVALFQARLHECQQHPHGTQAVCAACLPLLQAAADLYTADFLAGFSLSACPDFDEWQYFQAESYRRTLVTVLDRLAQGYLRQNQPEAAIAQARCRLSLDPLDEAAQRQLIALYAEAGNRTAALRQADLCVQLLQAELGAPPAAETAALIERIRHSNATPARKTNQLENRSRRAVHHNLPTQTTAFIGREAEMAEIKQLLRAETGCRLLNLVGPGGIGKTRLALAVAVQLQEAFPDGACFVALASVSDVEFTVPAIAEALRFSFHGQTTPKDQLLDYLQGKRLLLIVDNFEHLLAGVDLFSAILHHAPEITILVTARARLNLQEEWVYSVQGLPFPARAEDGRHRATLSVPVSDYSAVTLFLQRARQAVTSFAPTDDEMVEIVRICQLVEGMPLGLELAAPWVRILSCREIAQEIQQSLDFLTTPLRNLPERHRSLRVVFAQSRQRLSPTEQTVLQGLSVFRGGCTRQAAEQVTGATLPILSSLVDKALLRRTASGRYELHELIRQFAEVQFTVDSHAVEQAQQRHQAYFIMFLETRTIGIKGARQKAILNEIRANIDNIRLVWRRAVEHRDAQAIERASECLFIFYLYNSGHYEGQVAFQQAVAALATFPDASVDDDQTQELVILDKQENLVGFLLAVQAYFLARTSGRQVLPEQEIARLLETKPVNRRKAGVALAFLTWAVGYQGRIADSMPYAEQALALSVETGDSLGEWWSLIAFGSQGVHGKPAEAEQFLKQSLMVCQKSGDPSAQGFTYQNLGWVSVELGKYREATHCLAQSITLFEELGNIQGLGTAFMRAGNLATALGDYAGAIQNLRQAQSCFDETRSALHIDFCRIYLGVAYRLQGNYRQAEQTSRAALATFQAMNNPIHEGYCLLNLGCLALDQGDLNQAEQLQREALERWQRAGVEARMADVPVFGASHGCYRRASPRRS